ncbi:MAG: hypothetical protein SVZ03_10475 [Spirochaetota bacterium]|nr:hypothetical protein [Spirochaetota bacterium]
MEKSTSNTSIAPDKSIDELEANREWWWVAEKRRSKRLDYLRKAVWKKGAVGGIYSPGVKIDLERAGLFTKSWKETEDEPIMMRRAKAVANVLDNIIIFYYRSCSVGRLCREFTKHATLVSGDGQHVQ